VRVTIICVSAVLFLSACVNLKYINDFSASAIKGVVKFETAGYSFTQICVEDCRVNKINLLDLNVSECDCKADKKADSVTLQIYRGIKGYFDGLNKLSAKKLSTFKIEPLSKSLASDDLGSLQIDKKYSGAYSAIAEIVLRATTDQYRSRKLQEYIRAGNEPTTILIEFLDFNLSSNLSGKLDIRKEQLKISYFNLIKDQSLSAYEKRRAVEEYYNHLDAVSIQKKKLGTFSKTINKIAVGHQNLSNNLGRMSAHEIREQIKQFIKDLNLINQEFTTIKNN
jgi:hypothetical protein